LFGKLRGRIEIHPQEFKLRLQYKRHIAPRIGIHG
jgi:hypothetical protein